ncbi:hypothetical protein [[Acholeplasma] multilocale]|uniref:hypothetical protein n=1 Tax=[Acholeplasma] multilocale TaxID=264638 RepID=UPI00047D8143|nr:hypothetical protein [[Acholeplasma] multilocale]
MGLKTRLTCYSCENEKIITKAKKWVYENETYVFCTRSCAIGWFEKNLIDTKEGIDDYLKEGYIKNEKL